MNNSATYLEFLRFCLNDNYPIPACIKEIRWHDLLEFSIKHTISGLFVPTVLMKDGKLKIEDFQGNKPTDDDVMEWVFEEYRLNRNNTRLFEHTQKASDWFLENGFRNCILKGQGNALMYPNPYLRAAGDIDIWLEGGKEKILAFTKKYYNEPYNSMHVDFPMFRETPVEVHFHPTRMFNPRMNKKMWDYCDIMGPEQFENRITSPDGKYSFCTPTNEFNLFYQLDHIFRHVIYEGIGLRQIIDYYFLLRKRYNDGITPEANEKFVALLKKFRMHKFAKAMMYLQKEVLGLDEKYLYTKPNKSEGKFLLNEILEGGNFGKYEKRLNASLEGVEGHFKRFIKLETFRLRLLRHYPSEAVWMPFRDLRRTWERNRTKDGDTPEEKKTTHE